jgi:two-component system, NarL family, sensor histidine kinase UhpB
MKDNCRILCLFIIFNCICGYASAQASPAISSAVKDKPTNAAFESEKNNHIDINQRKTSSKNLNGKYANAKLQEGYDLDKLAETSFKSGKLNESELYNNKLLTVALSIKDSFLIISSKNREGLYLMERGKNKEAENAFVKTLAISKNFPTKTAEINSNLGSVYLATGDKEQASKYFFQALQLYEGQHNLSGIGETYSNIASVHYLLGKVDKAIDYQKKGIEAREIAKDKSGLIIANNNLSQLYLLKGNKDQSLIEATKAVAYAEELKNPKLLGVSYGCMTMYYTYNKNFPEALLWQTKSMQLYEGIDDKQQLSRLYVSAANLANAMKDSSLALSYFDKALNVSKALNNKENVANVYEKMSNYYSSHNDYKNALKYYKNFLQNKDSINAKSNAAKIEEIKTQYETEKKDNEIKKLQIEQKIKTLQLDKQNALLTGNELLAKKKEAEIQLLSKEAAMLVQRGELQNLKITQQDELIEKQQLIAKNNAQQIEINKKAQFIKENELMTQKKIKYLLIAGLFIGLLFTGLFINRLQLKKKIEQQNALLQIRNSISKDLHDEIGSTLTSISILSNVSELALEKQPIQAKEMIHQIAMQSKSIQQSMSDIVWSIRPENESVENLTTRIREYAAQTLEPLNISTTIDLNENVITQKLPMQYRKEILLICKEALNNIAKHSGASKATIGIIRQSQTLVLSITDNGVWKGSSSGTGTKSMAERATAIGGKLKIEHGDNGTSIKAIIPIP